MATHDDIANEKNFSCSLNIENESAVIDIVLLAILRQSYLDWYDQNMQFNKDRDTY